MSDQEQTPKQAMHWRSLTTLDLPVVQAIAETVHPDFPEDTAVFSERQRLYPDGARLLELDGRPAGYIISHPWRSGAMPRLNSLLGAIPSDADVYYFHDLALLNPARGTGAAALIVGDMLRHARAQGFARACLVAVNGSQEFWHKHGFRAVDAPDMADALASYAGTATYMSKVL